MASSPEAVSTNTDKVIFGLVAGEVSGDNLGAGLIKALQSQYPNAEFIGIGGPKMQALGLQSLYPMERLSLMGIAEVLPKLPGLLAMRRKLAEQLVQAKVDVFIGIDAPDFNLGLERKLKDRGVKTVQYVSPSVWAWRQGRVKKIAKAVDLMLTLLPFEADFYRQHNVEVCFVGHRLAHEFPVEYRVEPYRARFDIADTEKLVGLLPGSRGSEIQHHLDPLLDTAEKLSEDKALNTRFMIPAANQKIHDVIRQRIAERGCSADIQLVLGESQSVMSAADVLIVASGTVTFEAMLLKKPMVVIFRTSALSAAILTRMVKSAHISLPNLLADERVVPEILQDDVRAEVLEKEVRHWLQDPGAVKRLHQRFTDLHKNLRQDSDKLAASAIISLLTR